MEPNLASPNEVPQAPALSPVTSIAAQPFQGIQELTQLTELLTWKSSKLLTALAVTKSKHYSTIFLKKKAGSGKLREIHNPDTIIRAVQYRILNRILERLEVPDYIYAFERGASIPRMAEMHANKGLVISLDLKDYFSSIKQVHLHKLFTEMGFGKTPATTLSELCTYKAFVPQGALTSPKISNLITATTFGPALKEFCAERGYTLSVYADDITISLENDIAKEEGGKERIKEVLSFVSSLVRRFGFRVNREKTKVMRPFQRQYVCGAVVNQKVNLQKAERQRLRAVVHNCEVNGLEAEAAKNELTPDRFASKVMGQLNWFNQLNPEIGGRLMSKFKEFMAQHRTQSGSNTQ